MESEPIRENREQRTDDAFNRFVQYETLVESVSSEGATFRANIGASAPTSSLLAAPPQIGKWKVQIHDKKEQLESSGRLKTMTHMIMR
mmetsp:Transcript_22919/g.36644  ORF Transcript_22919/g.36644 Transcript_22919/m.36644 type:complete len:88 (-) Transcript_22919:18-281(-)